MEHTCRGHRRDCCHATGYKGQEGPPIPRVALHIPLLVVGKLLLEER